ncbi:hypothetical protein ACWV26_17485 [Rummeliibacillus sp. JY-2-4R]
MVGLIGGAGSSIYAAKAAKPEYIISAENALYEVKTVKESIK